MHQKQRAEIPSRLGRAGISRKRLSATASFDEIELWPHYLPFLIEPVHSRKQLFHPPIVNGKVQSTTLE